MILIGVFQSRQKITTNFMSCNLNNSKVKVYELNVYFSLIVLESLLMNCRLEYWCYIQHVDFV